jgi:hypothetical protein
MFNPAIAQGQSLVCATIDVYAGLSVTVSLDTVIAAAPVIESATGGSVEVNVAIEGDNSIDAAADGTIDVQSTTGGTPETKDC